VAWLVGSAHPITWRQNLGTSEAVRLELSRDGGTTWEPIADSVTNPAAATGTFSWLVTGPATSQARVRVTWIANGSVQDISDVNFRIR
jgi:hypothetical protein